MRPALHAEWTKLRTTAGPAWLLVAAVAGTVALGAAVTAAMNCPHRGCGLIGIYLGQAPVAILAVLAIGGEYSTGLIRVTLTAVPRRVVALAAKAIVLALTVAMSGGVAFLASLLVARAILLGNGHPAPSLADGPTLRAYAGAVLSLVLIALLSLGVAAAVRDSATAIGTVLGLLYLPPILAQSIDNPHWQRLLQHAAPSAGPAVLAAWAAGAFLLGTLLLERRDA